MAARNDDFGNWTEFRTRDGRIALKPVHVAFFIGLVVGAIIF